MEKDLELRRRGERENRRQVWFDEQAPNWARWRGFFWFVKMPRPCRDVREMMHEAGTRLRRTTRPLRHLHFKPTSSSRLISMARRSRTRRSSSKARQTQAQ